MKGIKKVFFVNHLFDEVRSELDADSSLHSLFRFKMLPLIASSSDHRWSNNTPRGLSEIEFSETSYSVAWSINRVLLEAYHLRRIWAQNGNRWAINSEERPPYYLMSDEEPGLIVPNRALIEDIRIAHPAALNLSLQLRPGNHIGTDHILSVATKYAAKAFPTVVSAGNWGEFGENSLSPLGKLPWTLSIGASSDISGKTLHPNSSIGKADTEAGQGVDFVAYGRNEFVDNEFGTSFSAPRVVGYILFLTCFILQLRAIEERRRNLRLGGVPLLQTYFVDTGMHDFDPTPETPLSMIPDIGVDTDVVRSVLSALTKANINIRFEPCSRVLLEMLKSCALPMEGYSSHEVGFGFLSDTSVFQYLADFTAKDLLTLFLGTNVSRDVLPVPLGEQKIAIQDELGVMFQISEKSRLHHNIDYKTGDIKASMRDPSRQSNERGYFKEPSSYSWPSSLS